MKYAIIFLLVTTSLFARSNPALIAVGVGYWDSRSKDSTALFQAEYKFSRCYFNFIRPQISLITPGFHSLFAGGGIAIELYMSDHFVFCPNFEPGLYYHGGGRDLGFPIEFRSCLEVAYEFCNKSRLGAEFYHISNAHLGRHNPGANCFAIYYAFALF